MNKIHEIAPTHQEPQQDFNKSTHSGSSNLKRKDPDLFDEKDKIAKRKKVASYVSPSSGKPMKKNMQKYRLNRYKKRLMKRYYALYQN